jgi:hypothetical protein
MFITLYFKGLKQLLTINIIDLKWPLVMITQSTWLVLVAKGNVCISVERVESITKRLPRDNTGRHHRPLE